MYITNLKLENWRNFKNVLIDLKERMFFVGPNASGKSNLLDVFRFLHDIAKEKGGGLQQSVADRGGISKIRCLATRRSPEIIIGITLTEQSNGDNASKIEWKYEIAVTQEPRGDRLPILKYEKVYKNGTFLLERPNDEDKNDPKRLTQTHLEQINMNKDFRDISNFLQKIYYLHLIPQVIRHPNMFPSKQVNEDPFGMHFLTTIAETTERIRTNRLKKIEDILQVALPQLKHLSHTKDIRGLSHLEATYEHWRARGAHQQEDQFSDGTLRLIGLFWSLLESDSLLLLEEPELSLNASIVQRIPSLVYKVMKTRKRQVFMTTHSSDLLYDSGIALEEVAMLIPDVEGTKVIVASSLEEIKSLIDNGLSMAEVIIPRTEPKDINQLELPFSKFAL